MSPNFFSDTATGSINFNSTFFTKDGEVTPVGSSTPIKIHALYIYKYKWKGSPSNDISNLYNNSEDISGYILQMTNNSNYTITNTTNSNNKINLPKSDCTFL